MKKILFCLLVLTFALTACDNNKENENITSQELVDQALAKSDWTVAAHLSQRILIEEIDINKRWKALQNLVAATKKLGDLKWTITSLEGNSLDFTTPKAQEYINYELMLAYESLLDYNKSREYAEKLLANAELTDEEITKLEITIANYSLILSDFDKAESSLISCLNKNQIAQSYSQCTFLLGNLYYLSDRLDESMIQINNFLNLPDITYPDRAQALFLKGDMLELQGDKEQALELYKQSVRYHPNPETIKVRINSLESKK